MDRDIWRRHRLSNLLQSLLLIVAMAAIFCILGWILGGTFGVVAAIALAALLVSFNSGVSPRLLLRMYGARPIDFRHAPALHHVMRELAVRAELPVAPALYYVPSQMLNAFAVGTQSRSAVAVTDGLLRHMNSRELTAVLAHEVSHVRNHDTWVMGLADLFSRVTSLLSSVGQLLLLVNLPLLLFSDYRVSWIAIIILILAPTASGLIQLALSRTREFDADLSAAELTGDPQGMAMALGKLDQFQGGLMEQVVLPGRRVPDPSLLRTHPPTQARIERLLDLVRQPTPAQRVMPVVAASPAQAYPNVRRAPRRHLNGLWY